jgi:hypothetical protein
LQRASLPFASNSPVAETRPARLTSQVRACGGRAACDYAPPLKVRPTPWTQQLQCQRQLITAPHHHHHNCCLGLVGGPETGWGTTLCAQQQPHAPHRHPSVSPSHRTTTERCGGWCRGARCITPPAEHRVDSPRCATSWRRCPSTTWTAWCARAPGKRREIRSRFR